MLSTDTSERGASIPTGVFLSRTECHRRRRPESGSQDTQVLFQFWAVQLEDMTLAAELVSLAS